MNNEYKKLKEEYDDISNQIKELHIKQKTIRNMMEKVCPHEILVRVDSDSYLVELGVEDEEVQFKCSSCYRYFNEKELLNLKKEEK